MGGLQETYQTARGSGPGLVLGLGLVLLLLILLLIIILLVILLLVILLLLVLLLGLCRSGVIGPPGQSVIFLVVLGIRHVDVVIVVVVVCFFFFFYFFFFFFGPGPAKGVWVGGIPVIKGYIYR
jgi:hypothetical protein